MKKGKTKTHIQRAPRISVLIVTYHAEKILFNCIASIIASKPKTSFEIIVIDNAPTPAFEKQLAREFPSVTYVKSPENKGFGGGINLGAKQARGEYLCLLNPDIILKDNALDALYKFCQDKKDVGVASAVLLGEIGNVPELLGAAKLTPLRAIFSFSFIHTLFPNNPIAKDFWIYSAKTGPVKQAQSVPIGTAMIKRSIFEAIGGFDEQFFLYYEDFDFDRRVEEAGYKNYLLNNVPVIHLGGKGGTASVSGLSEIYKRSRFLYFRKFYGLLPAVLTTTILSISKYTVAFWGIILLAAFLLFYRLSELMMFIGDFGWFYLSARDMLLTGHIPLVGIPSSHPWLHQGPLWTYLLAGGFAVSSFHPLSGGVIAVMFGLGSVYLMYQLGKDLFSNHVGLIAALMYATSPLVIIHARMPYHTATIPFFTLLLLYSVYRWIKGNPYFFPVALFSLSVLYNLELAAVVYWFAVLFLIVFGFIKRPAWLKRLRSGKVLGLSVTAFIFPLIPILVYDVGHGFPQTLKFAAWMGYKVLVVLGYPPLHPEIPGSTISEVGFFFIEHMRKLLFLPNLPIALALFLSGVGYVIFSFFTAFREKRIHEGLFVLALFLGAGVGGFFAAKTTSEAYLPMIFPSIMLSVALFINRLLLLPRIRILGVIGLCLIIVLNMFSLLKEHYLMALPLGGYGPTFFERHAIAEEIVKEAGENEYTMKGAGSGSQFDSYTMNYAYLTWWKGHGPDGENAKIQFTITDTPTRVLLKKEITR